MGEYLIYYKGILFCGICYDRLLFKIVPKNEKYHMKKQLSREGTKPMYFLEEVDNKELLK